MCLDLQATLASLAFSITTEPDLSEPLNFIAPSEADFAMWTDGVNSLLGYTVSGIAPMCVLCDAEQMEVPKVCVLDENPLTIPSHSHGNPIVPISASIVPGRTSFSDDQRVDKHRLGDAAEHGDQIATS